MHPRGAPVHFDGAKRGQGLVREVVQVVDGVVIGGGLGQRGPARQASGGSGP